MRDFMMAEIRAFAGDVPPDGWAWCEGQLLPTTDEHASLFALLGNRYGGDGYHHFALPDLRGRVPVGTVAQRDLGDRGDANTALGTQPVPASVGLRFAICIRGPFPARR